MIHVTVLRAAVVAALFIVLGAMCASHAAAFSYSIDVTGNGVTASGSITFPFNAADDPAGIDLSLDAVLFGKHNTFTAADLQSAIWTGAAPNDLDDLVVGNLTLIALVGDIVFILTDDSPTGNGEADCTDAGGPCGTLQECADASGAPCLTTPVTWTFTAQPSTPVPEPSTIFHLLAGLSAMLAGSRGRRIWRACRTPLQRTRARGARATGPIQ